MIREVGNEPRLIERRAGDVDCDEFFGVGDRQLGQDDGVEELENTKVGADAERQREQCCRSECRSAAELAKCIANVVEQVLQPQPAPALAGDFLNEGHVAEFAQGSGSSVGKVFAASDALRNGHPQVRFELLGERLLGSLPRPTHYGCASGSIPAPIARTNCSLRS